MLRVLSFAFLLAVCATVYGGEEASVLVNKEPTPANVVVKSSPCTSLRCRLYNVEESCTDSCRKRLIGGGYVKKTTVRKVYKPVN